MYGKGGRLASEEVVLSLLRSRCLPILLYATEACPLLSCNKQSFEFTVTRIFMKIFRTSSPEIVRECQVNFNFAPIQSQINTRTVRFLQNLQHQKIVCARCSLLMLLINWANSHHKLSLSQGWPIYGLFAFLRVWLLFACVCCSVFILCFFCYFSFLIVIAAFSV